jgi:hypothetical protein
MRTFRLAVVSLFACSMCCASMARADEGKPPAGKAPEAGAKHEGGDAKKDAETIRVERAKALVKDLEAAIARAKAAPQIDAELLQKLTAALEQAKALAVPAKPAELTAEEKKAVVEEAKKQPGGDAPKDQQSEMADRMFARAFDGADLSEEESIKARKIIGDWWSENMASMGESKKQSEIKRKRDDDLEKALGKKKAQKVINNLNAMGPGRGR